jgi:hypothetical protein
MLRRGVRQTLYMTTYEDDKVCSPAGMDFAKGQLM